MNEYQNIINNDNKKNLQTTCHELWFSHITCLINLNNDRNYTYKYVTYKVILQKFKPVIFYYYLQLKLYVNNKILIYIF